VHGLHAEDFPDRAAVRLGHDDVPLPHLRRRRIPVYLVAAPIVITIVAITMTFYQNRYRASAETAFCLLAAVAIDTVIARARREPSVAQRVLPDDARQRELADA